jgi:Peptidase A4 family
MKKLLVAVLAAMLAAALAVLLVPGAARSEPASSARPSATQVAQARAAFNKYMSSHAPLVRSGTAEVHADGATSFGSINWSGYADVEAGSHTFSGVSGHWTIPAVSCPAGLYRNQDAFIAQWVGLDGATNGTVEQLGTGTQCYEGVTYYYVWYEMFPNGTVEEGTQACINDNVDCPRPGDQISASVGVTPGTAGENNYTLSLTDYTQSDNDFSVTQSCATDVCLDQSAEWIVERPAFAPGGNYQILPLVDFFRTGFTDGTQVSGRTSRSIANFQGGTVYDVQMVDDSVAYFLDCVGQFGPSGQLLLLSNPNACPVVSPISGNSFSTTWDSSF